MDCVKLSLELTGRNKLSKAIRWLENTDFEVKIIIAGIQELQKFDAT